MATKLEKLALELLELPASSRAELARRLIYSLDDSESPDAEALWVEELKKRDAEVSKGEVQCVPAEGVLRRARDRNSS